MKDRLRKSRYNPKAKMSVNVFHFGNKRRRTLKKYLKSLKTVSLPMLGENLFKNIEGVK